MAESKHEVGELGEGIEWQYCAPYQAELYAHRTAGHLELPCPHAKWSSEPLVCKDRDGRIFGYRRYFEVPEAAVCFNEAGHNQTALCLECLEAVRQKSSVSCAGETGGVG